MSGGAVRQPPFIGLTGAVAAGKSEALADLGRLGAATLSSDAIVHELLASDQVRDALVERWGPDVAPAGAIDRGAVGRVVFERPEELAWLEGHLHPLVGERVLAWRDGLPADTELAVVEVPLLFEADMGGFFDATVAIVADEAHRAERAGALDLGELAGRDARQLPQDEKAARATYVVRNDGTVAELEEALRRLYPQLLSATATESAV